MNMDYVVWDYEGMLACAKSLDKLRDRSNANKITMDGAFEELVVGMDAETGKAFLAAYETNVSSVALFAQLLDSEAKLLRANVDNMRIVEYDTADKLREMFGV